MLIVAHPCDKTSEREKNGRCDQLCIKDGNHAKCACEKDFKLAPDGRRCIVGEYLCR